MSHRPLVRAVLVAATALAGVSAAGAVAAEDLGVAVVDDAYRPAEVTVAAGDRVVWRWDRDNVHEHTVVAIDGQFDSDRPCEGGGVSACRGPGTVFSVTFEEPGTYRYRCRVHLTMVGQVEVTPATAASEPTEEPTPDEEPTAPAPTDAPSPQPSSSPSPRPSGSPSTSPSPGEAGSPPATATASPREPRSDTTSAGSASMRRFPGFSFESGAVETSSPAVGDIAVAPPAASPSPSFAPFPSASPLATAEAQEDLAVEIPVGGRQPPRGVLTGIAVASVLGSAGAVARVILRA